MRPGDIYTDVMKYILAILTSLLLVQYSHASTLAICRETAAHLSKMLPMRKDGITVIREAQCMPSTPKNRLVYILEVNAPIETLRQFDLRKEIKPGVLNTYCTDPEIRVTLNAFDIDHRYFTPNGTFAGSFLMRAKECR